MIPAFASTTALQSALSDLLRLHAPQATLLASVGEEVLRVRADAASNTVGADLVPPDDWFEHGEMTWLTRDGALLGLVWSEDGQLPGAAVQVLTMLLAAARLGGEGREAEVLVTQLPMATAWFTADLVFRRVSRPFLELFGLSDAQVSNRPLEQVFPDRPAMVLALQQAASGRSVRLADEHFGLAPGGVCAGGVWARGEARPYFGGAAAGVMLTLQDVSGEYERASRVAALLDTDLPAALLTDSGIVLHASQGLIELAPPNAQALSGAPLWAWPCFAHLPSGAVRELVQRAAQNGQASGDVELASGERLPLSVRRTSEPGLLVAEGWAGGRGHQAPTGMIGQMLSQTEDATVMIDSAGRAQLVSERAAQLLGVEATRLVGLGLSRVLGELGVRVFTPQGDPLELPEWRDLNLPLQREVLLSLPDGALRYMELRVCGLDSEPSSGAGGALLTLRDLTALRRAQARVRHTARHDALTGLLNRVGLREALSAQPGAAVVACLDIDGFGSLNAALGRTACDRMLIQLAARLHDLAAAQGGSAARLADDTFALLLPGCGLSEATAALQALFLSPVRAGQRDLSLSFALGLVTAPGQGAQGQQAPDPETLLNNAELAMQHARRQGRAQVGLFDPGMRAQVARAFELEDALRGAAAGGQFALLYQPISELSSGRVLGAEALLRWNHPVLGVLPPSHFLSLAGHSDLITEVGEWVVQEALRGRGAVRAALPEGSSPWQVSVNLSLEELRRSSGLGRLLPLLAAQGAPDIEVAAGSLLDHSQETLGLLEHLRTLGAQLSVDDFGDGASSLSALTRFPLSGIKLHPTLTARLPDDERSLALVQGTIDLAHRLGLRVVAVGVETEEQLAVLRELGCDAAQGYAICPPLAVTELLNWLGAH